MMKAVRELLCQQCAREYPVWYCDHLLWVPVAKELEIETGIPIHFLCLDCFASHASRIVALRSEGRIIWKLDVGKAEPLDFTAKDRDAIIDEFVERVKAEAGTSFPGGRDHDWHEALRSVAAEMKGEQK